VDGDEEGGWVGEELWFGRAWCGVVGLWWVEVDENCRAL
jgi:hypothetical protein